MSDDARDAVDEVDDHATAVVFVCDVRMANDPAHQYGGGFAAHGPAVINGFMCDRGTLRGSYGAPLDGYFDFSVVQRFTCSDEESGFTATLHVKMYQPTHTYFVWEIGLGRGHHSGLSGRGSGVGTASPLGRDVIRDHYFGHLESVEF